MLGAYEVSNSIPDSCVRRWLAWIPPLRHIAIILIRIKIIRKKPMDGHKYGEGQMGNILRYVYGWTHQFGDIWRWV